MGIAMFLLRSSDKNNMQMADSIPACVRVEMAGDISLLMRYQSNYKGDFPASRIQKGLILACNGMDLSEEGVGFGVPVLKSGRETIFPGDAHITSVRDGNTTIVSVGYNMNLQERMEVRGRRIKSGTFYRVKEYISGLHREYPWLRKVITGASGSLRCILGIRTVFEETKSIGTVRVVYTIGAGKSTVHVSVNTGGVYGCTEMIIMNEQGATYFDRYRDSNGTSIAGEAIGTWDETYADEASFIDPLNNVKFTLQKVKGARMLRGRELVKSRLAWSGISYVIPPYVADFAYSIRIGRAGT